MTEEGLVEFCRSEYPRLVGVLGLYCGSAAVGEELAQEVLARVWRNWRRVQDLDRPEAWAYRVGVHLANSHFRRIAAERRARTKMGPEEHAHAHPPDDAILTRRAVAALPRRQRQAVILHYFLDLPLVEVAHHMETSESAVKSLLHRALGRLRSENGLRHLLEVTDVT